MTIAEDFLHLLEQIQGHIDIPLIIDIHIAPSRLSPQKSCKFGALVLENDTVGLTYTGLEDTWQQLQGRNELQTLIGKSPLKAAELYIGEQIWQRALGLAAINAISQLVFNRNPGVLESTGSTLETTPVTADTHVGMVGYFPSLVDDIRNTGARLTVIELDDALLQSEDNFVVTSDTGRLAHCEKIYCTGTTLINHTIDHILNHTKNATSFHLIGPTTGCLPDPLFARGITTIGGRRILDSNEFIHSWKQQTDWSTCTSRYQIRRETYPSLSSLISSRQ